MVNLVLGVGVFSLLPIQEIGRNRPFSPFFCLFRPFAEGPKTEDKGLFAEISSNVLCTSREVWEYTWKSPIHAGAIQECG